MSPKRRKATDRDIWVEDFAAELTSAAYPVVLRRGLERSWLNVEPGLWKTLAEAVEKWAGESPPAAPSGDFDTWAECFLADLAARVSSVAMKNGFAEPLLDLRLGLRRALGPLMRRYVVSYK